MMTTHEWLTTQATPLLHQIRQTAFVTGIGTGELTQAQRDYYVAQDHYYIERFTQMWQAMEQQLPPELVARQPKTLGEAGAHATLEPSAAAAQIKPGQHNLDYLAHMEALIAQGDGLTSMLALLPCTESYYLVAKQLGTRVARFQGWIDYYRGPEYQAMTEWCWQVVDHLTTQRAITQSELAGYLRAYEYELLFWEKPMH